MMNEEEERESKLETADPVKPADIADLDSDSDSEEGSEDESPSSTPPVSLGFLEAPETLLHSKFFPSKAGGHPAWLHPQLPTTEEMLCKKCGKPLRFLLQIYAPLNSVTSAYHRTLFVFVCARGSCLPTKGSIRVLRSQLGKQNPFYPDEEPEPQPLTDENRQAKDSIPGDVKLCHVCGARGSKACSKCKKVTYCTKDHQLVHWRSGHSKSCSPAATPPHTWEVFEGVVFPEFEILTEEEEVTENADAPAFSKEKEMYKKYLEEEKATGADEEAADFGEDSWKDLNKQVRVDDVFNRFQDRLASSPDQVVRYCRSTTAPVKPLWTNKQNRLPLSAVPPCPKCNGPRIFEFQILYLLRVRTTVKGNDDLTWGTVAVFSCKDSCVVDGYQEEFVWYQPELS